MGTPEQSSFADISSNQAEEILDPRHFYASYVFEYATLRGHDVAVLLDEARQFECPVRYWWASETTNLTGAFDRLIVCAHHPSLTKAVEMHGNLRQAAARHQVVWDEFDAAKLDEYRTHGKAVAAPQHIAKPDGTPLFLAERAANTDAVYTLTRADLQVAALGPIWGATRFNYEYSAALLARLTPECRKILQPVAPLRPPQP